MKKSIISAILITVLCMELLVTGCTNAPSSVSGDDETRSVMSNQNDNNSSPTSSQSKQPSNYSTSKATKPTQTTIKATNPPQQKYYCRLCERVVVSKKGDACNECLCQVCGRDIGLRYDGYGRYPYCDTCDCNYYGCRYPAVKANYGGGYWCELHACHEKECQKQAEKDSFYCKYHQR